jgi:hypothetical protein
MTREQKTPRQASAVINFIRGMGAAYNVLQVTIAAP